MSILTKLKDAAVSAYDHVAEVLSGIFHKEVEPALIDFIHLFTTDVGKLILTTAISLIPSLPAKGFAAVTAEMINKLISESAVIAKQDATLTLNQVQSALQIAKVSVGVITATDQKIVDTIPETCAACAALHADATASEAAVSEGAPATA